MQRTRLRGQCRAEPLGAETEEQRRFLVSQGCLMAGFLLGHPLQPDAVEALVAAAAA